MAKGYFFTGFPGFICNQLIREVFKTNPPEMIYVLVLPNLMKKAEQEKEYFINEFQIHPSRFNLIEGDITNSSIMAEKDLLSISKNITHVFHLAAIYDLAVPKDIAFQVNVNGTKHINEWVKTLPVLERYVYFSTAYVAGRREGVLLEDELIRPNQFKNYYEETKFEAEVLVQELKDQLPITIIRPGIVKGNTYTGETIKFDGPYFILQFFDRLKFLPFIPYLGKTDAIINLVPIDFILNATTYLSFNPKGEGKTYHLTDPKPYTVTEIYELLMQELIQKKPKGKLPLKLAKYFLKYKQIQKILKVEREALDYFEWKGIFDSSNAQKDLLESGIQCPDFKDGVESMVSFYKSNKHKKEYQINI